MTNWVALHYFVGMRGTLYITILSIRSSYLQAIEEDLDVGEGVPDTVQWWITATSAWRIKTFGIDHDIHTYFMENAGDVRGLAVSNTQKSYGDVIRSQHNVELADSSDVQGAAAAFQAAGLEPSFDIAPGQFLFWKPDNADYCTQSQPE